MERNESGSLKAFVVFASFVLVAAVLYFAKTVFMPIAVALLFTFLLSPVVIRLQKWKLPKPVAIITAVTLAFSVFAFVTWLVTSQLVALAGKLPRYEENLHAKLRNVSGPQEQGVFTRAADFIKRMQKDLERTPAAESSTQAAAGSEEKPVKVEVKAPKPTVLQTLRRAVGPMLGPVAMAGMVVLLVVAMLFTREDLRDRFIKVVSGGQLNVATEAVDDAARRISRFLGMQLVVNVTYGIPIGIGLFFIGVPSALLWGVLATLLRFIPFIGPWIAASFPVALAFAIDPGWTKLLLTVGLFLTIELISNNLVEPWLYGNSTGVSVVAVIAGAIFWTWLWGGVGLFLAMPLTVCLVVLGKYVPGLRFMHEMFGSEAVLDSHARLYQRMLALDSEEMLRIAEEQLEKSDLPTFYDQVMIPALIQAEEDRQTGTLAERRQQFIIDGSRGLIEDLDAFAPNSNPASSTGPRPLDVLCLPARDDADEIVGLMLAQLLRKEGVSVDVLPATVAPKERQSIVCSSAARWICISALPPSALPPARRLCRSVKQYCPDKQVLVGVWTPHAAGTEISNRLAEARPDAVATTLREILAQFRLGTSVPASAPEPAPPLHDSLLDSSFLREARADELFDLVQREAAKTFAVPMSLVSIAAMDRDYWRKHLPAEAMTAEAVEALRQSPLGIQAAAASEPFAIEDVEDDKRLASDTFVASRGIRACAVAPLITKNGRSSGALCVFDTKPRKISADELCKLQAIADRLVEVTESPVSRRK